MDPARKRQIRLVIALGTAVVLAAALVYTSFSASTEAREPSELLVQATPGESYDLTGRVAEGSVERSGSGLRFAVADRDGSAQVPVTYTGQVPDPFREGREVIVTGEMRDGTFVADKDSLITKCPSKFSDEAEADPEHVIIED